MRSFILAVMLCLYTLLAVGQTSSPPAAAPSNPNPAPEQGKGAAKTSAPPTAKRMAADAQDVGPDTAVITIKGLCSTSAPKPAASKTAPPAAKAKPATCQTTVTKKQLELVIEAVRPNLQPSQRRNLAQQYVELLTIANAASKAGLEKDPKLKEQLQLQKMRLLATTYTQDLQKKEADVPEADIQKYYKENVSKYEEAKVQRIYVPMVTEEGKPPDTAASKLVAEKIQQRAAAGEDFDKLQKEAFSATGNKNQAPPVDLGERRRGTLPPKQEEAVFNLKPGEVSAALDEVSGYYIYKMISKDTVALDKVRDEIKGTLGREHLREKLDQLRNSVEASYSTAYFGSPAASPPPAGGELHSPAPAPSAPAPAAAPAPPAQPAATPVAPEAPKTPPAPPGK